jgi:hypothetical protein
MVLCGNFFTKVNNTFNKKKILTRNVNLQLKKEEKEYIVKNGYQIDIMELGNGKGIYEQSLYPLTEINFEEQAWVYNFNSYFNLEKQSNNEYLISINSKLYDNEKLYINIDAKSLTKNKILMFENRLFNSKKNASTFLLKTPHEISKEFPKSRFPLKKLPADDVFFINLKDTNWFFTLFPYASEDVEWQENGETKTGKVFFKKWGVSNQGFVTDGPGYINQTQGQVHLFSIPEIYKQIQDEKIKQDRLLIISFANLAFSLGSNQNYYDTIFALDSPSEAEKQYKEFKKTFDNSLHYTQGNNMFYRNFNTYDEIVGTGKYSGNQFSISNDGKRYIVDGTFTSSNNYGSKSSSLNLAFTGDRVKLNSVSKFYEEGHLFSDFFTQPLQFVGIYEDSKDPALPAYLSNVKQAKYIILDSDELSYFTISFDNTGSKPRTINFVKSIVKPQ